MRTCATLQIVLFLLCLEAVNASIAEKPHEWHDPGKGSEKISSHSCIHDQILEQRRRPGHKVYSVTPQVYQQSGVSKRVHRKGRALLGLSTSPYHQKDAKQPIRIYLNYDAVGHSPDRDCRNVGDIVKVGVFKVFLGSPLHLSHCGSADTCLLLSARGAPC